MPIVISHHTALTSLTTSCNHRYFDTGRETFHVLMMKAASYLLKLLIQTF